MKTKIHITEKTPFKTIHTQHLHALLQKLHQNNQRADYLRTEISRRLLEKKADIKKQPCSVLDLSFGFPIEQIESTYATLFPLKKDDIKIESLEKKLPFKNGSFDCILSNLTLPYVDDIPSHLINLGRTCKKDGFILASTLGSDSFKELKQCFRAVEGNKTTPHFMPMPTLKQLGDLMVDLGFKYPVIDKDIITITYPSVTALFAEMTLYGSKNLNTARKKGLTTPSAMKKIKDFYEQNFQTSTGDILVTLEIFYLYAHRP